MFVADERKAYTVEKAAGKDATSRIRCRWVDEAQVREEQSRDKVNKCVRNLGECDEDQHKQSAATLFRHQSPWMQATWERNGIESGWWSGMGRGGQVVVEVVVEERGATGQGRSVEGSSGGGWEGTVRCGRDPSSVQCSSPRLTHDPGVRHCTNTIHPHIHMHTHKTEMLGRGDG